jgi:putative transposase
MTHRGWHCVYDTHYHIVFPVKYRKALLFDGVAAFIKEIAKGLEERYELDIEQIGCDKDHIHVLASFHPRL